MSYRVFIPTKNRAARISTHLAFAGADYTIVVHDQAQYDAYCANPTVDPARVVISGVPADAYGLTRQREWVCRHLARRGEWFVFADDNIRALTAVMPDYYHAAELPTDTGESAQWKAIYGAACDTERFMAIAQDTIAYAQRINAHLCGFSLTDNPFFRSKKLRPVGFVIGKLMLWHNISYIWSHDITMEDFRNTAEHLLQFGAVAINNYVFPVAGHYEAGGMGPYDERVPYRLRDVQTLMQRYPGLLRVKDRKGFVPGTDLQVRFTTSEQVQRWRQAMFAQSS